MTERNRNLAVPIKELMETDPEFAQRLIDHFGNDYPDKIQDIVAAML